MAILKHGMFGNYQGKLGNMVFYVVNGKQVVRTIGKNTKPPTVAQLKCRKEMKMVHAFLKPVTEFVNLGFYLKAKGTSKTPYNMAFSYIKRHATEDIYTDLMINYEAALFTKGSLTEAIDPEVELVPEGLKFNWLCPDDLMWPHENDQVMLLAYFPNLSKAVYLLYGAKRVEKQAILQIAPELLAEYMEVYISFISERRNKIADSTYLGSFNK